jgi:hypothetical protein
VLAVVSETLFDIMRSSSCRPQSPTASCGRADSLHGAGKGTRRGDEDALELGEASLSNCR